MTPCAILSIPHNFRDPLYDEGEGPNFCHYEPGEPRRRAPQSGEWAQLPIEMPSSLIIFTDRAGRVIAASADGKRIKWSDLDMVVRGVEQYNADIAEQRTEPQ